MSWSLSPGRARQAAFIAEGWVLIAHLGSFSSAASGSGEEAALGLQVSERGG